VAGQGARGRGGRNQGDGVAKLMEVRKQKPEKQISGFSRRKKN